jgi:hypothetical protein
VTIGGVNRLLKKSTAKAEGAEQVAEKLLFSVGGGVPQRLKPYLFRCTYGIAEPIP